MPTSQQLISKTVTERQLTTEVLDTVDNIRTIVKP